MNNYKAHIHYGFIIKFQSNRIELCGDNKMTKNGKTENDPGEIF